MAKSAAGHIFLFCIVLALLAQAGQAQYKELMHEGWHGHNDSFTVEGIPFKTRASADISKVVVYVKDSVVAVENGTCLDIMNMSICLKDVNYPSFELHKLYDPSDYEYNLEVWFYLANLTIEKQIDETKLLVGQKVRVEVRIKNDGSLPAEGIYFRDIYFSDYYPDFFISNVWGGCTYSRHNITWEGTLKPTRMKICSYDLEAAKPTTFQSVAKATYLVGIGNKTRTASSELITLVVPEFELTMEEGLNASSADVGEEVEFNATLNNTLENRTFRNVALTLDIPPGLALLDYSDEMAASGSLLRWRGTMDESESRNLWARFIVRHSGNNTLKTNLNYNVDHIVRIVDEFDSVYGIMEELALDFASLPDEVGGKSSGKLEVNIRNPSEKHVFDEVNVDISTNLPINISPAYFEEIGKNQSKAALSRSVAFPDVEDITHYKISFDVSYRTEYGQEIRFSEKKTITVNPVQEKKAGASASPASSERAEVVADEISSILIRIVEIINAAVNSIVSVGSRKFMIGFTLFAVVLVVSLIHFAKKMVSKVKEYEKYEHGK